jgi:hypothetical protein
MSGNNERETAAEFANLLRSIEQRLALLEQQAQPGRASPVIRNIREPSHTLESTEKVMTDNGFSTVSSVPVCVTCHRILSGSDYFVCSHCHQALCADDVISLNRQSHCETCFRRDHLDLTRRDYVALISVSNGITDPDVIADITELDKDQVKRSLSKLASSNLIATKPYLFGFVREIKTTDGGAIAIDVYRKYIYGQDEFVIEFGRRLREYLGEKDQR